MMVIEAPLFGGIDAGGTSFKCGLANADGKVLATRHVPVRSPKATLADVVSFFRSADMRGKLSAIGLASFGPIDIDPASAGYGTLADTPKQDWSGFGLRRELEDSIGVPVHVDTDVNGALLAEMKFGAAKGVRSAVYITVGTGIGAGVFVNGDFAGRPHHPEFGHIPVTVRPDDRDFAGTCPFHGCCLEGLVSAPAIRARFGEPSELPPDHVAWVVVADYLAQACRVLFLTFRPERIVLGGGVVQAHGLVAQINDCFVRQMNTYLPTSVNAGDKLIVEAALGQHAGLTGAILLAREGRH